MPDSTRRPVVKAFLVCDTILHDAQTNKRSLIGVFHDLGSTHFPAIHPNLWIYANLTDAKGRYEFEFRLVDMTRNTLIGGAKPPPIEIVDPRQSAEFSAQLRNLSLPAEGTYEFQLLANQDLIATKAIRVVHVDGQGRQIPPAAPPPAGGPTP